MRNFKAALLALAFTLGLVSGNANASIISMTVTGDVIAAQTTVTDKSGSVVDPYWGGLTAGDTITADLVLDITGYTGIGSETFNFTGSNTIDVTAGLFSFDESMDSALTASVSFYDGVIFDLNLGALFGVNGAPEDFTSYGLNVLADRSVTVGAGGKAITTQYQFVAAWQPAALTPVPVPAALWLFGSGLIGLAGMARRKAA